MSRAIGNPKVELNFARARGASISDQRDSIPDTLHRKGDCRLVWVNEGDLVMLEMKGIAVCHNLTKEGGE